MTAEAGAGNEPVDCELMAKFLQSTGDYRILRRMRPSAFSIPFTGPTKRAVFLDVETTGLDVRKDAVIELAMLPFDYADDGTIVRILEPFSSFQDPHRPIPPDIVSLTGITDEMVRGNSIDPDRVSTVLKETALVIAHNAGFDRPFCEMAWPVFASKPWGCSLREVDWSAEGVGGKKLSQIAAGFGFYFDAHRAVDDCYAGVNILTQILPLTRCTTLAALLENARTPKWRIWAEGAPYHRREVLKTRGYRWSPGVDGRRRAWFLDVAEDQRDNELRYLRYAIYEKQDTTVACLQITAYDRYSSRAS